jgi:mannose-6-phosphate isomerase-like protein (cupin superfamily)
MKTLLILFTFLIAMMALSSYNIVQFPMAEGYVFERDADIAKKGPSPHNGKGSSVGYAFFEKVSDYKFSFRKRVLHRGSSIGYHKQQEDEVYYIISGTGQMTINEELMAVKPGDAILTRTGSSHGLEQTGKEDLVVIITYEK